MKICVLNSWSCMLMGIFAILVLLGITLMRVNVDFGILWALLSLASGLAALTILWLGVLFTIKMVVCFLKKPGPPSNN